MLHFVLLISMLFVAPQFATFPGFNPDCPTPLPHGLDTLEQMKRITSAQMRFAVKVSLGLGMFLILIVAVHHTHAIFHTALWLKRVLEEVILFTSIPSNIPGNYIYIYMGNLIVIF